MTTVIYARRIKCDLCGREADAPDPFQAGAYRRYNPPDGWITFNGALIRSDGLSVNDICDECAQRPIIHLATLLFPQEVSRGD